MTNDYADNFFEIGDALSLRSELKSAVIALIETDAIPGKALEGGNRLDNFRKILTDLVNGEMTLEECYWEV